MSANTGEDKKKRTTEQKIEVRKGQVTEKMSREAFRQRFMARFYDPAFRAEDASLARVEDIAWKAYSEGRKSPLTEKAEQEFADPDYDLSNGVMPVNESRLRSANRPTHHRRVAFSSSTHHLATTIRVRARCRKAFV